MGPCSKQAPQPLGARRHAAERLQRKGHGLRADAYEDLDERGKILDELGKLLDAGAGARVGGAGAAELAREGGRVADQLEDRHELARVALPHNLEEELPWIPRRYVGLAEVTGHRANDAPAEERAEVGAYRLPVQAERLREIRHVHRAIRDEELRVHPAEVTAHAERRGEAAPVVDEPAPNLGRSADPFRKAADGGSSLEEADVDRVHVGGSFCKTRTTNFGPQVSS